MPIWADVLIFFGAWLLMSLILAFGMKLLNERPSDEMPTCSPRGRVAPLPLPPDLGDPYYEGFTRMVDACSHDPREAQRLGVAGLLHMYHCPECGCMVTAGTSHGPHDEGCWLGLDGGALALRDLQREVAAWQRRGLDYAPPPLRKALKVVEEAGEVGGAVNKLDEGRRTLRDVEDESGDVVISLCGLADSLGFDLATAVKRRWRGDVQWRTPRASVVVVETREPSQDAQGDEEPGVPLAGDDEVEG